MRRTTLLIPAIALMAVLLQPAQCASKRQPAASPVRAPKPPTSVRVDAPRFDLPTGATLLNEINLDQQNLLPAIKQALPEFAKGVAGNRGEMAGIVKAIDLNGLAAVIQDVKAVRIVNFRLSAHPDQAAAFLEQQVPESKGWKRILYSTQMIEDGVISVYSNGKSYLGFIVDTGGGDDNFYMGTEGFLDIAKLAGWVGKFVQSIGGEQGIALSLPQPGTPPAQPPAPGTTKAPAPKK